MATFVQFLRILIDVIVGRLFSRAIVVVLGMFGISAGLGAWVAFFALLAIVINPKTRKLWNLIREFGVHLVCRAINLITPVPPEYYGPQWAKY